MRPPSMLSPIRTPNFCLHCGGVFELFSTFVKPFHLNVVESLIITQLAKEYSEYFEKIADMMEVMGLHLSQLRRLPQLFPQNDQLKSFLVEVYQIMFEFCTKAR